MKNSNLFISLILLFIIGTVRANVTEQPVNRSCDMATKVCEIVHQTFDDRDSAMNCTNSITQFGNTIHKSFFYELNLISSNDPGVSINYSGGAASYKLYGPFTSSSLGNCEQINMNLFNVSPIAFTTNTGIIQFSGVGTYVLEVIPSQCFGTIDIDLLQNRVISCETLFDCTDCVSSFSPPTGRYIVSAWVKEANIPTTVTSYENTHIDISFSGATETFNLLPVGKIIDGWQKIEGTIAIPPLAASIIIELQVDAGTAFYDDVRFFPFDGSMMSYVYDPLTLRLMAELDERNYATLYEYDEEGKLIRVKKETEKGVMTIQENRDNIKKN